MTDTPPLSSQGARVQRRAAFRRATAGRHTDYTPRPYDQRVTHDNPPATAGQSGAPTP